MNSPNMGGPSVCSFPTSELSMEVDVLVETKVAAINPAVRKLMRLLKRTCCSAKHEFAVETALRESLANAIIHGNQLDPSKKVRVCCACDSAGSVVIVVKDQGNGFDPQTLPQPFTGENLASDHGRGIYLIRSLMDEVYFTNEGTEIHMRKLLQAAH